MAVRVTRLWPLVAALVGCGLVDPDISAITYQLYPVEYAFDTQLGTVPTAFYDLRCTPEKTCCDAIDCALIPLRCEGDACVTDFEFEQYATIDLRAAAPHLTKVDVKSFAELYVSRIQYKVESELNFPLPVIDLYLAPVSAISAEHPAAAPFAALPAVPARASIPLTEVPLDPAGRRAFRTIASAWTAFNLIASAPLGLSSRMAPIRGRVRMQVLIELAGALAR